MIHFTEHSDFVLISTMIELVMQQRWRDDAEAVDRVNDFIQRVGERLPRKGGTLTKREKTEGFRLIMSLLPKREESSQ